MLYRQIHWQVAAKSVFPIFFRRSLQKSIIFLADVYEANLKTNEHRCIFDRFIKHTKRFVKWVWFCGVFIFASYVISPALLYLFDNTHLEPMIPWVLPGTSSSSDDMTDYLINTAYNVYAIFCGVGVYGLYALIFAFLLLHVSLLTDIIRHKLKAIDQIAAAERPSIYEIKINLRNIVLIHNEVTS